MPSVVNVALTTASFVVVFEGISVKVLPFTFATVSSADVQVTPLIAGSVTESSVAPLISATRVSGNCSKIAVVPSPNFGSTVVTLTALIFE